MLAMHKKEIDESIDRLKKDMREEVTNTIRDSLSRLFFVDLSDEAERRAFIKRSRSRFAWGGLVDGVWRWLAPAIAVAIVGYAATFFLAQADARRSNGSPPAVHGSENP